MSLTEVTRKDFDKVLHEKISALECQTWNETVLHHEWKAIEESAYAMLEGKGQPAWDFSIMDWPTNIPLFNWCLNNQALCRIITLKQVQRCLQRLTLNWHIRLECYDNIHGSTMILGDDLGEALLTHDDGWLWNSPEFQFSRENDDSKI